MPNNIRDEIIDRLREAFESVRDNAPAVSGKPVQLVSVMERFTLPTDLGDADLPAVSFGYGGSRLVDGAFTQEEENIFSVYVYPIVPILPEFEAGYMDVALLLSASAMEETVRRIVHDLNAYQIAYEDDIVIGVSVGQVLAGEGKFTEYEFMEFRLDFRVAYQIPLETEILGSCSIPPSFQIHRPFASF